jgi:hypothetical protein
MSNRLKPPLFQKAHFQTALPNSPIIYYGEASNIYPQPESKLKSTGKLKGTTNMQGSYK